MAAHFWSKLWYFLVLLCLCLSHVFLVEGWIISTKSSVQHRILLMKPLPNSNDHSSNMAEEDLPKPLAWKWSSKTVYAKEGKEGDWVSLTSVLQQQEEEEVLRTWNWSRRFVSKLNLCPWAKGSLETQTAMQVFVAPPNQNIEMLCKQVGAKCLEFCQEFPALESAAIFFLVFSPQENHNDDHDLMDFMDFYDWFTDLEDNWEMEDIIIAPFHPQWQFGGGTDEELLQLDFEKKSPYPTVTFVSASAVERAGTAVTEQISKHNEQVLLEKSLEELKEMWEESLSASADF